MKYRFGSIEVGLLSSPLPVLDALYYQSLPYPAHWSEAEAYAFTDDGATWEHLRHEGGS